MVASLPAISASHPEFICRASPTAFRFILFLNGYASVVQRPFYGEQDKCGD